MGERDGEGRRHELAARAIVALAPVVGGTPRAGVRLVAAGLGGGAQPGRCLRRHAGPLATRGRQCAHEVRGRAAQGCHDGAAQLHRGHRPEEFQRLLLMEGQLDELLREVRDGGRLGLAREVSPRLAGGRRFGGAWGWLSSAVSWLFTAEGAASGTWLPMAVLRMEKGVHER